MIPMNANPATGNTTSAAPAPAPQAPQGPGFLGVQPTQQQNSQQPQATNASVPQPVRSPTAENAIDPSQQSGDFKSNFKDFFANMWGAKKPTTQQVQPPINVTVQAPPVQPTIESQQQRVMQQLGLNPVTLTEEQRQKFANGDFSAIEGMLNQVQKQAFMATVKAAQALVAKGTEDALKKAQTSTQMYVRGSDARSAMQAELPFTTDPMFAPVAESVLSRALNAGLDTASAVKAVRGWFATLNTASSASTQANPNLSQDYSGGPQPVEINWAQLLGIAQK